MKRFLIPAVATLAVAACGAGDEPGRLPEPEAPVRVSVSHAVAARASEAFPATLAAEQQADVATRMSGTVREVRVDVGDRVSAGSPVVVLDAPDVQARIDAAEAQAALAESTFRRVESLAADRAASQQELDEARARLEAARGALADARAQAAYAVVRAPFGGVVTERLAEPGDLAVPGRPLLRMVGEGGLTVEADLPAARAGALEPGDAVRVVVPGAGAWAARVTRVAPAVARGTRRFRVEASLEGAEGGAVGLLPGAYARLELPGGGAPTWWIPEDAVVRRGQLTGVYLLEDDALRLRWLRLGERREGAVEILAGPAGEELTVVRRPAAELADGVPVEAATPEPWAAPADGAMAGAGAAPEEDPS